MVAADIAIYADGPARPTGGCGAVALLVGADAPLPIDSRLKATHASNTWDFFKPKFISEYPEVCYEGVPLCLGISSDASSIVFVFLKSSQQEFRKSRSFYPVLFFLFC